MSELKKTFLQAEGVSIYTWHHPAKKPRADGLTLVVLHGAGKSYSERFMPVADHFLEAGIGVIGLDFVGHGQTGGAMSGGSLELRNQHALAAIRYWLDDNTPLILLGSSMGGHTALRVTASLGNRIESLCLLQAALYAGDAEKVQFTDDFTQILRRPESWKTSSALKDASGFSGRVYVGIGSEDKVIPWEVTQGLLSAFHQNTAALRVEVFHGTGHDLPEWLPKHRATCQQMAAYLSTLS
jgi:alpha-beta hydrolase superfamily lysophospholipase